jgi:hypothetical protein
MKEIVEILNALLTPIIAILATYIAWQQYVVQHRSFSGQMYERRYQVFKAYMSFLADVMGEGKTTYQRLGQFYAEASEADYLFSDEIAKKREELYQRGVDMVQGYEQMYPTGGGSGLPVGAQRSALATAHADHLKWYLAQIKEVKDIFKKEMKIQ